MLHLMSFVTKVQGSRFFTDTVSNVVASKNFLNGLFCSLIIEQANHVCVKNLWSGRANLILGGSQGRKCTDSLLHSVILSCPHDSKLSRAFFPTEHTSTSDQSWSKYHHTRKTSATGQLTIGGCARGCKIEKSHPIIQPLND